jgi:cell division protein ZipA
MSELRWILLVAGIALVAAIYFWGMRSRQRSAATPLERSTRIEPAPSQSATAAANEPARLEPSFSHEDDFASAPEEDEPTVDFDEPAISRAYGRREPTFDTEVEPPLDKAAPSLSRTPPPPTQNELEPEPRPVRKPEPPAESERPKQKIVAVRVVATPPLRFEGTKLAEVVRSEGLEYGRYEIFHNLHTDGRPIYSLASLREPGTFDLGSMPTTAYPGVALFAVLPGPLSAIETFDQLIFTARAFAAQLGGTLADDRGAPLTVHRITRLREEMVAFERQRSGGGAD